MLRFHRCKPNPDLRQFVENGVAVVKPVFHRQVILTGCRRCENFQGQVSFALQRLLEECRHQIYRLGLGCLIEPLAVQFQHQVAFLGKGQFAECGVLLEMQRDFQTFRVLGVAPAECHRQLYLSACRCH